MQPNVRRRFILLITIVVLITTLIIILNLLLIAEPPFELTLYHLTASAVAEHNATVEMFIQQTQTALTATPIQR